MRTPDTTNDPTARLGPDAPFAETDARIALGRYRLERRIGAGGFGVVWRAHDEKLERHVAVKVIPRGRGDVERARVDREAVAAARLNHPGIVALYEFGSDEQDTYLVSELVNGATLEELSAERAVSDRDVARIGRALCAALEHAHARGVIHRDVKPGNVMVLAEPAAGAGFAKLTDFGIAHLASGEDLTATGDVVGTLAYMAPEQAEGRRVTAACDLYSLALTLYEAWTGTNPARRESPAATARRMGSPLPPLRGGRPDLPPRAVRGRSTPRSTRIPPCDLRRPSCVRSWPTWRTTLDDEGGLVEPETLERFGLTAVRARTRVRTLLHRHAPGAEPVRAGTLALLAPRLAAGAAAGLLVLTALETLGPDTALLQCARRPGSGGPGRGAAPDRLDHVGAVRLRLARDARGRSPRHRVGAGGSAGSDAASCCRARACCGRSRRWRRCWERSRWRRCSWASPRWPRPPHGAPGWPRPDSSGSR